MGERPLHTRKVAGSIPAGTTLWVGKSGLRTLTKSLASGLGQYGITVDDVSPGFIETIRDMDTHPEVTPGADEGVPPIPIRRQPTPEELWAIQPPPPCRGTDATTVAPFIYECHTDAR